MYSLKMITWFSLYAVLIYRIVTQLLLLMTSPVEATIPLFPNIHNDTIHYIFFIYVHIYESLGFPVILATFSVHMHPSSPGLRHLFCSLWTCRPLVEWGTREREKLSLLFFSPNREPVHRLLFWVELFKAGLR